MSWTCTLCGRNKFGRKNEPHKCQSGMRKHWPEDTWVDNDAKANEPPELPEGWKWIYVSVPVTKDNIDTYIGGEGMAILDTAKVKAFMVKYNEMKKELEDTKIKLDMVVQTAKNRLNEIKRLRTVAYDAGADPGPGPLAW